MNEVDQDGHLDLVVRGERGDDLDLVVVAVHHGEPRPQVIGVAAVRFGERLGDDLASRLADGGEHGLACCFRAGGGASAAAVAGPEEGGEDVAGGAGGGRDVGDGGQLGHPLAGFAQLTGIIRPAGGRGSGRPGRRGLRGRGPQRAGQHRERGPVRGQQQPGCRVARLRAAGGVERPEVRGRATASSSDCRFPRWIAPCALTWAAAWPNGAAATAPALRRMIPAEYDCGPQFSPASCGYRFSLPLAVGDPRGCHRPVNHRPDPLVPVLAPAATSGYS